MARRSIEERLAQLEAQRQALKARLGKQERARDTRRKVLLGALILHRLSEESREFDRALRDWLQRELPGFLTREEDKTLFPDILGASAKADAKESSVMSQSESGQKPLPDLES